MSFLSSIAASVIEWLIAKLASYGVAKVEEIESESKAKAKAEADVEALGKATDEASRAAVLETMMADTLGATPSSPTKPDTTH